MLNMLNLALCLHSNPEYKDMPIDIAQLPNLPEKTSESSETSDSESESKENSGTTLFYLVCSREANVSSSYPNVLFKPL